MENTGGAVVCVCSFGRRSGCGDRHVLFQAQDEALVFCGRYALDNDYQFCYYICGSCILVGLIIRCENNAFESQDKVTDNKMQ